MINRVFALVWLSIIIALGLYNAKTLFVEGKVQFDLLALLPQGKTENMRLSNELMEDGNISGRLVLMFGHKETEISEQALMKFRNLLKTTTLPLLEHDVKQIETDYISLFTDLYPHRAGLMSKKDRQHLLLNQDDVLIQRSIANIMSPFGTFSSSQINTDPFGFFPGFVTSLKPSSSFQIGSNDNVTINSNDKIWAIYQGEVTEKIFSLKLQEKISETLLPILAQIEKDFDVEILRVGAAFYASAGAQQAQNEISTIGLISTLGIILILLLFFRSLRPILLAITVVSSGLLCGLAACLYLFGSIHILALVFGCSLVGVAVDYALHYYCASFKDIDRFRILSLLLPAMPLGVLTSSIGYGALIIAPFPGIRQMAVLSCIGLICTFISLAVWGPYFIKSGTRKASNLALKSQELLEKFSALGSIKHLKTIMSTVIVIIFCIGAINLTFDDNVRNFQSMDPQLKSQEERIKAMMNFDNSTKFLAINDRSLDNILQIEEEITLKLDDQGVSYRALSDLIPSQKRQLENSELKLKFCQNHFIKISDALGLDETAAFDTSKAGFDETSLIADAQLIKKLPTGWKELVHVTDDGLITGRIMINSAGDSIKKDYRYIDPALEYSSLFASYRQAMLILVAGLLLGFALMIAIKEGIRAAIVITSPILLAMLSTIGVIGLSGIGFSMFHAMGLILVLCIGIDYALFLYWREQEEDGLFLLGNGLAAITTILSFGLLALSTTTAVHSFGLTVFIGIVLNFFITSLFLGHKKCENS